MASALALQAAALAVFAAGFFQLRPAPLPAASNDFSAAQTWRDTLCAAGAASLCGGDHSHGTGGRPARERRLSWRPFDRLVFVIVDALRADFVYDAARFPRGMAFVRAALFGPGEARGVGLVALARAPTVTMPRLKALTAGTSPVFLDLLLNLDVVSGLSGADAGANDARDSKLDEVHDGNNGTHERKLNANDFSNMSNGVGPTDGQYPSDRADGSVPNGERLSSYSADPNQPDRVENDFTPNDGQYPSDHANGSLPNTGRPDHVEYSPKMDSSTKGAKAASPGERKGRDKQPCERDAANRLGMDSWVAQLAEDGSPVLFHGDDTWQRIFPGGALHADSTGVEGFFAVDTEGVDRAVERMVPASLSRADWRVLALHFLGLDHVGHSGGGPRSPLFAPKLEQMDRDVRLLYRAACLGVPLSPTDKMWLMRADDDSAAPPVGDQAGGKRVHVPRTLLAVLGDHGMTDSGNHGGSSRDEVSAAAVFLSPLYGPTVHSPKAMATVEQTDIATSIALVLGLAVPAASTGRLVDALLPGDTPPGVRLEAHALSTLHLFRLLHARGDVPAGLDALAESAFACHAAFLARPRRPHALLARCVRRYELAGASAASVLSADDGAYDHVRLLLGVALSVLAVLSVLDACVFRPAFGLGVGCVLALLFKADRRIPLLGAALLLLASMLIVASLYRTLSRVVHQVFNCHGANHSDGTFVGRGIDNCDYVDTKYVAPAEPHLPSRASRRSSTRETSGPRRATRSTTATSVSRRKQNGNITTGDSSASMSPATAHSAVHVAAQSDAITDQTGVPDDIYGLQDTVGLLDRPRKVYARDTAPRPFLGTWLRMATECSANQVNRLIFTAHAQIQDWPADRVVLAAALVPYVFTQLSSAYVVEEHEYWHHVLATALLVRLAADADVRSTIRGGSISGVVTRVAKTAAAAWRPILALVAARLLRYWNAVGLRMGAEDALASHVDGRAAHVLVWLSAAVVAGGVRPGWLLLAFSVACHRTAIPSAVWPARVLLAALFATFAASVRKRDCPSARRALALYLILCVRPRNAAVIALVHVLGSLSLSDSTPGGLFPAAAVLGHASFFGAGASHSVGAIDFAPAYTGMASFVAPVVGAATLAVTWGPWLLSVLPWVLSAPGRGARAELAAGLAWRGAVCAVVLGVAGALRHHLLVWSVFAPRVVFEAGWLFAYACVFLSRMFVISRFSGAWKEDD